MPFWEQHEDSSLISPDRDGLTIARRFNAGNAVTTGQVPQGRPNWDVVFSRPCGTRHAHADTRH
jgi:hypothetical protein